MTPYTWDETQAAAAALSARRRADVEHARRQTIPFDGDELGEPYATHGDRFPWGAVALTFGGAILGALFLAVLVIQGYRWPQ